MTERTYAHDSWCNSPHAAGPGPCPPTLTPEQIARRTVNTLIERATRAMLYWVAKAEETDAVWQMRNREEGDAADSKGLKKWDGSFAWQKSAESIYLIGNGTWAHRKVRTYALVVQALTARAQLLGDNSAPIPDVLRVPDIFGFDQIVEPTIREPAKRRGSAPQSVLKRFRRDPTR